MFLCFKLIKLISFRLFIGVFMFVSEIEYLGYNYGPIRVSLCLSSIWYLIRFYDVLHPWVSLYVLFTRVMSLGSGLYSICKLSVFRGNYMSLYFRRFVINRENINREHQTLNTYSFVRKLKTRFEKSTGFVFYADINCYIGSNLENTDNTDSNWI